jgi:hypothetical protein
MRTPLSWLHMWPRGERWHRPGANRTALQVQFGQHVARPELAARSAARRAVI